MAECNGNMSYSKTSWPSKGYKHMAKKGQGKVRWSKNCQVHHTTFEEPEIHHGISCNNELFTKIYPKQNLEQKEVATKSAAIIVK